MSIGNKLERAEMYSFDSKGRRLPPRGDNNMRVHETPPHALSHPERDDDALLEEQALVCAPLTPEERAVLDLQSFGHGEEVEREVDAGELDAHLDEGWSFASQRPGGFVVKRDFIRRLTYGEIAQALGLSERQVQSRVVSGRKKIRKAKEGLR